MNSTPKCINKKIAYNSILSKKVNKYFITYIKFLIIRYFY